MISQIANPNHAPSGAKNLEVPVLIVGGGGAGLTASMLLSQLGVEHLLVSALPTTSILPKAHVLNQRTMEILADVGVAEEIYAKSTPAENMRAMGWYAGLAGPDPGLRPADRADRVLGRRLHQSQLAGGEPVPHGQPSADPPRADPEGARRSAGTREACASTTSSIELAQDADGVTARIRDSTTAASTRCARSTCSAATAAARSSKQVGIELRGPAASSRSRRRCTSARTCRTSRAIRTC